MMIKYKHSFITTLLLVLLSSAAYSDDILFGILFKHHLTELMKTKKYATKKLFKNRILDYQ